MKNNVWTLIVAGAIILVLLMMPIIGSISTETIRTNTHNKVSHAQDMAERRD